jgi:diaminopimelate decarboxylase
MIDSKYIEAFKPLETPFYFYDLELLRKTLSTAKAESEKYGYHVHYALKANNYERILNAISRFGFGADCVSGNEVEKAVETGFSPGKIAFAGVGKTDKEIVAGLEKNIFSFNCESIPELEVINSIAGKMGKIAPVAIRINPDVDPKTHQYITTGLKDNKFGINHRDFNEVGARLRTLKNLRLRGIHFHIGSQITDVNVFKQLSLKINIIQQWFEKHDFDLETINVGGGLGINYVEPEKYLIPDFTAYFKTFHDNLELKPGQELHFELGRSLVAQCGYFITKVLFVKEGLDTKFLIVDGGMNDLLRPMLYQAHHKISSLISGKPVVKYDVVGPVCETTDVFARGILLPESSRGDLIAIHSAGAYAQVMASTYNMRNLVTAFDSETISD